jgi:MSHA biogenesis protein MshO
LGDNISPSTSSIGLQSPDGTCGEPYLTLSAPFQLAHRSPRQRFYLIDTPIAYVCDIGAGTLTRYSNYALTQSQANVDSAAELLAAGAQADPVAIHLTSCNFNYVSTTNTGQRSGLATLNLQLTNAGERIQLLHQVQVNNLP